VPTCPAGNRSGLTDRDSGLHSKCVVLVISSYRVACLGPVLQRRHDKALELNQHMSACLTKPLSCGFFADALVTSDECFL